MLKYMNLELKEVNEICTQSYNIEMYYFTNILLIYH